MTHQPSTLITQFNALDAHQQKQFIENLREKIQKTTNSDYINLLNNCINIYNNAHESGNNIPSFKSAALPSPHIMEHDLLHNTALRAQFNTLSTVQQKQFIENMRQKIQNTNNTEYVYFLNECIHNYNTAAIRGETRTQVQEPTGLQTQTSHQDQHSSASLTCACCGKWIYPSLKKCPFCYTPYAFHTSMDYTSLVFAIIGLIMVVPPFSFVVRAFVGFFSGLIVGLLIAAGNDGITGDTAIFITLLLTDIVSLTILVLALTLSRIKAAAKNTTAALVASLTGIGFLVLGFLFNLLLL